MGFCHPYHRFKIFGRFLSILIGGDSGEQFRFILISSPLEVGIVTFFYISSVVCTPFEQLAKMVWISFRITFQRDCMTIHFQHPLWLAFGFALHTFEVFA